MQYERQMKLYEDTDIKQSRRKAAKEATKERS
jgi:hypothetical protein